MSTVIEDHKPLSVRVIITKQLSVYKHTAMSFFSYLDLTNVTGCNERRIQKLLTGKLVGFYLPW